MLEKLSKDYDFVVTVGGITVQRLSDDATRAFNMPNIKDMDGIYAVTNFMNSLTDELMESYFPKPKKK